MPGKRVSMRKTKEILRLALNEGLSQREIAISTGVGKTTIQELLAKVKKAKIGWEQLTKMRETEIVENVLYPALHEDATSKIAPDWALVRKQLMEKGNTLALIWMDFKQENPSGFQYSRFCELYREWNSKSRLILRQYHEPGKSLFVDFSGLTVPWLDENTGEIFEAQIFVAALGASNYTFAKACPDQTLDSWINCHVSAFKFFRGVPKIIVPDNLRAGVSRACRYDPDTNPTYLALADHYDTAVMPTRAYKPKDKAKVEVAVQIVQRWILAILRRQTFTSVEAINTAIRPLLIRLNDKTMRHLKASRKDLFEKYELPVLKKMPPEDFEISVFKNAKVNIDYHIEFERHYYSVPFIHIGKTVLVKASNSLIQIFISDEQIATHKKHKGIPGRHTTIFEHMPPQHAEHVKWTPERILNWAKNSGQSTKLICEKIMGSRKVPEQGFRACLGVLRLGEKHDAPRLENACAAALKMGSYRYKTIETLIKTKDLEKASKTSVSNHENIRGAKYYN